MPRDFEEYFWKCYNINLKEFKFSRGVGVWTLDNSRSAHEMQVCSSTKKKGYSTMSQSSSSTKNFRNFWPTNIWASLGLIYLLLQ